MHLNITREWLAAHLEEDGQSCTAGSEESWEQHVKEHQHDWIDFEGLQACRACGIVQNAHNAESICPGKVQVRLRVPE